MLTRGTTLSKAIINTNLLLRDLENDARRRKLILLLNTKSCTGFGLVLII